MTSKTVDVSELWTRLGEMEREARFNGRSYPEGMCKFPFSLSGQGFFPGGDGLWRQDNDLAATTDGKVANGGILFLGNDFGTLKTYLRLKAKGFEKVPTWERIKTRVRAADIPDTKLFFTNA